MKAPSHDEPVLRPPLLKIKNSEQFRTNTPIARYHSFRINRISRLKSFLAGLLDHSIHLLLHRLRDSLHFQVQKPADNHRYRGFLGQSARHQVLDLLLGDLPDGRFMRQLGSKPAADLRDRVDHSLSLGDHQSLALDVSLRIGRIPADIRAREDGSALRDGARDALAARSLAVEQRAGADVQLGALLRQQHAREVRHRVFPAEIRHGTHLRERSPRGPP